MPALAINQPFAVFPLIECLNIFPGQYFIYDEGEIEFQSETRTCSQMNVMLYVGEKEEPEDCDDLMTFTISEDYKTVYFLEKEMYRIGK